MTPEEMREAGQQHLGFNNGHLIYAVWWAAAEICERLDLIIKNMPEWDSD